MRETVKKPKLRFKGFTDDWEQRKLGDIGDVFTGNTPSTTNSSYYSDNGILWITPTDIKGQVTKSSAKRLSLEGQKVARIVPKGSILITSIASIGKNTLINEPAGFNQQINALVPYKNSNSYFLLSYSFIWSMHLKVIAGAGTMQIINKTEFSKYLTYIPKKEEQSAIGQLMEQIDNLITANQRQLDKLQELKKGLLQKMFPKNGAKNPELRVNGFTDDWEQRKLGEMASVFDGTHQTPKYTTEGIPFVSVENIKSLKTDKYISKAAFDHDFKHSPEYGDILMTRIGDVGTANIVNTNDPLAYYVSLALIKPKGTNAKFLLTSIESTQVQRDIWRKMLHVAFPQKINKQDISTLSISLPLSVDEQIVIGNLNAKISNLITANQRQLDKLQELKKSLLQKMFI